MPKDQKSWFIYAVLLLTAFTFRTGIARLLPNDDPYDGKVYAQIARNVLEQRVYSPATEPPYEPSLIRLPGYPLFLAGVYAIFGHGNNTAVRIAQAFIDTVTCALIALIAFYWEPEETRKRNTAIATLALSAFCPFTAIYVATILTETPTTLLAVAASLSATLAFYSQRLGRATLLWALTGLLAGLAVLFRPDIGLFAAGIGLTLVVSTLWAMRGVDKGQRWTRLWRTAYQGAVFSLTFCLVLTPWTIRNHRLFHVFQPLAPAHAETANEFVPRGYLSWLRSWLDDHRYVGPVLWSLDELPLKLQDFPDRAFDSAQEKQRVGELLDRYNHPPQAEEAAAPEPTESESLVAEETTPTPEETPSSEEPEAGNEEEGSTEGNVEEESSPAEEEQQEVAMTPEIDAGFAQIAHERITRAPFRYYFRLPVRRAISIWFDTHSQYYPFEGELFPLSGLDHDLYQHVWLPLFAGLTWVYTLLGVAGGWILWRSRKFAARRWLLLTALLVLPRWGFFSTVENPEPRYVVELFPFFTILAGIAVSRVTSLKIVNGGRSWSRMRE